MDKIYCQCMTLIILLLILNIGLVIGVIIKWQIAQEKCGGGRYVNRRLVVNNRTNDGRTEKLVNLRQYPFAVRIFVKESGENYKKLYCGGAIVGSTWVITAARCIDMLQYFPLNKISIRGSNTRRQDRLYYDVIFMVHHNNDSNMTYDIDIGLLKVKEVFRKSLGKPVLMANSTYEYKINKTVTAVGWTNYYKEEYREQYNIRNVTVTLLDHQYCTNVYKAANEEVTEFMLCAGSYEGEKSACHFDPGSPLLDDNLLIGITSWGNGCEKVDEPIVYTKTSLFEEWVHDTIGSH